MTGKVRDVMLDLETMGLGATAAIIQIGAVAFDPAGKGITRCFKADVSLQSSLMAGMTLDMSTVEWWREHKALLHQPTCLSLGKALAAFTKWWRQEDMGEFGSSTYGNVWSNGASFDVPIMEHALKLHGMQPPWHYRNVRDQRTLKAVALSWACSQSPRWRPATTRWRTPRTSQSWCRATGASSREIRHDAAVAPLHGRPSVHPG